MRTSERQALENVIRLAAIRSGLGVRALSRKSGVPLGSVSSFLSGKRGITLDSADKLCEVLRLRLVGGPRSDEKE